MSFCERTEEYYKKFIELQEQLRKSEEERLKLEMKFNEMMRVTREEEQRHYRKLRNQYERFIEEDRKRQDRNDRIVRSLERIENRIASLQAKTERFKLFKKQYHAFLQRVYQSGLAENAEQKEPPKKETIKVETEPNEIIQKYLESVSSRKLRDLLNKDEKASSNSMTDEKSRDSERYDRRPNYSSSIADDIMNSIYSRNLERQNVIHRSQLGNQFPKDSEESAFVADTTENDQSDNESVLYVEKPPVDRKFEDQLIRQENHIGPEISAQTLLPPFDRKDHQEFVEASSLHMVNQPISKPSIANRPEAGDQLNIDLEEKQAYSEQSKNEPYSEVAPRAIVETTKEAQMVPEYKEPQKIPSFDLNHTPSVDLTDQFHNQQFAPHELTNNIHTNPVAMQQADDQIAYDSNQQPYSQYPDQQGEIQSTESTDPQYFEEPVKKSDYPDNQQVDQRQEQLQESTAVDQQQHYPQQETTDQYQAGETTEQSDQQYETSQQYQTSEYRADQQYDPNQSYQKQETIDQYQVAESTEHSDQQYVPDQQYQEGEYPTDQQYDPNQQYQQPETTDPYQSEETNQVPQQAQQYEPGEYPADQQYYAGDQYYDENGQPYQQYADVDQYGQAVQYDEQGQPIAQQYYDENQQYQQYPQYDENGQPVDQDEAQQHYEQQQQNPGQNVEGTVGDESAKPADDVAKSETGRVMEMLDTDTESVKQDTKVSNDSDFDFSAA